MGAVLPLISIVVVAAVAATPPLAGGANEAAYTAVGVFGIAASAVILCALVAIVACAPRGRQKGAAASLERYFDATDSRTHMSFKGPAGAGIKAYHYYEFNRHGNGLEMRQAPFEVRDTGIINNAEVEGDDDVADSATVRTCNLVLQREKLTAFYVCTAKGPVAIVDEQSDQVAPHPVGYGVWHGLLFFVPPGEPCEQYRMVQWRRWGQETATLANIALTDDERGVTPSSGESTMRYYVRERKKTE